MADDARAMFDKGARIQEIIDAGLSLAPIGGDYAATTVRTTISEARAEKMADAMVWRRLETDRAYNNAEDAESQALREAEIGAQVWREIEERYDVS